VEYERAPAVTRERMYLDAMQQILSATSKVIIDQKAGGQNLLYLPLDKLMQLSSGGAQQATVPLPEPTMRSNVPTEVTAPSPDATSRRDSLRSRDRDAAR
jgi:membrane protease subunit HflK